MWEREILAIVYYLATGCLLSFEVLGRGAHAERGVMSWTRSRSGKTTGQVTGLLDKEGDPQQ